MRGQIPKCTKNSYNSPTLKKKKNLTEKWAEDLNRRFPKKTDG